MNREAVERRKTILVLGAIDMLEVAAAAEALQAEHAKPHSDFMLIRALETALVVAYWRPFSQSNTVGHLATRDALDRELHNRLKTLRDHVYAHVDVAGERTGDVRDRGSEGVSLLESSWGFPEDLLPRVADVVDRQEAAWTAEAVRLSRRLAALK